MHTDSASPGGSKPAGGHPSPAAAGGAKPHPGANRSVPAAAPPAGGTSSRVPRATTDRVPVSPDAHRTTAALRRTTGGARAGGPSWPPSRKARLAALLAILGLGAAIAGLAYLFANRIDPAPILEKLETDFVKAQQMPDTDILAKEKALLDLVERALRELGPEATVEFRKRVEHHYNVHVKGRAENERAARRVVPAYIRKFEAGRADPARQDTLLDEVNSLKTSYAATAFGERIEAIRAELQKVVESRSGGLAVPFVKLQNMVVADVEQGDVRAAIRRVADFGIEWKEGENADLAKMLKELREKIQRESVKFVKKRIQEARRLHAEGRKDEAARILRDARPGLEGCAPETIRELEKEESEMGGGESPR
jgi:hypothetical protein